MKANHTPGPWKMATIHKSNENANKVLAEVSDGVWRSVVYAQANTTYFNEETTFANARLISAAPELLEACIRATDYLHTKYPKEADIFNQLQAAINKATE